jgi:hypothetical protein
MAQRVETRWRDRTDKLSIFDEFGEVGISEVEVMVPTEGHIGCKSIHYWDLQPDHELSIPTL